MSLTVGKKASIDYKVEKKDLASTFVGMEGKLYMFEIEVVDSAGVCGRGTHTRAIISTQRLLEGAKKRALKSLN